MKFLNLLKNCNYIFFMPIVLLVIATNSTGSELLARMSVHTQLAQSRKSVEASEKKYRSIFENASECIEAGMDDDITKPVKRPLLSEAITKQLRNSRSTST